MASTRNRVIDRHFNQLHFSRANKVYHEQKLVTAAEIKNLKVPNNEITGQRYGEVKYTNISANGKWIAVSVRPGFIYVLDARKHSSHIQIDTNNELFKPIFHPRQENTLMGISRNRIHIRIWKFKNKALIEYLWHHPAFVIYNHYQYITAVFQEPQTSILIACGMELVRWDMGKTDKTISIAHTGSIHNRLAYIILLEERKACITIVTMGLDLALADITGLQTTLEERDLGKLQYWPTYDEVAPRIGDGQQNIIQTRIKWDGEQSVTISQDNRKMAYFRQPNRDKNLTQLCMISLVPGRIGSMLWQKDLTAESISCTLSPSGSQLIIGKKVQPHQETLIEIFDTARNSSPVARIEGNIWAKYVKITGVQYFPTAGLGFIYSSSEGVTKLVCLKK